MASCFRFWFLVILRSPLLTRSTPVAECSPFWYESTQYFSSDSNRLSGTHSSSLRLPAVKHKFNMTTLVWPSEWVSKGKTSHSTHYRSFQQQFYTTGDPTNNVQALKEVYGPAQHCNLQDWAATNVMFTLTILTFSTEYILQNSRTFPAHYKWQASS